MKPLTAEEIAELRRKADFLKRSMEADESGAGLENESLGVANDALRLLDEVEQWRNPESVKMWRDENAATLDRARALLKRIEWSAELYGSQVCPDCRGDGPGQGANPGHYPDCELAALIAGTEAEPDLRDEVERLRKLCALAAAELRGDRPDGTWDDTVFQLEQAASGVRQG